MACIKCNFFKYNQVFFVICSWAVTRVAMLNEGIKSFRVSSAVSGRLSGCSSGLGVGQLHFLQFESNMDEENNLQISQDRESDSGENCKEGLLNETMELSSTTALEETIYDGQKEAIMEIEEDVNMADEEKNQESNDFLQTSKDSPTSCEQEMSDLLNKSSVNHLISTSLVRNI